MCVSPVVVRAIEIDPVMRDDAVVIAVHADLHVVPGVGGPLRGIALDAGRPPVIALA